MGYKYRPGDIAELERPKQRSLHAVLVESARIVFCASLVLFSFSVSAFDLDGAWVTKHAANCSKVFWKRNNQIRMARNADTFGGGFLVDGNRIRRPFLICNIDKRTDDGDMLHLMASCSGIVDFLAPLEFDLKIEDNNKNNALLSQLSRNINFLLPLQTLKLSSEEDGSQMVMP